jgi:glycosyltransferase involved in cell wall biosynthesis
MRENNRSLVSVITVVRNAALTLERAIRSVLEQTYRPIEYIVIDGGSTDGTVVIIRRFTDSLAHWRSEPDRGISDAFNKGLAAASGRYVALLNADDWLEPQHVARAVAALERTGAGFVFGDLVYHAPDGRALHRIRGDPEYARHIQSRMPEVNHPTMLVRRTVYDRVGGFDPAYRCAMDYDWLLRVHRAGIRGAYDRNIVAHMSLAGRSDEDWRPALAEVREISLRHGQPLARAWSMYGFRLAKGWVRRMIERLTPDAIHGRLRQAINPAFTRRLP